MNISSANVELSKNELELVTSSEFILTKNRIIEKVYNLFGVLSEIYKDILSRYSTVLPVETFKSSPKIYKGENYLNLPYVMMDYPRIFAKEDVFAIRSFFWWGNFFSITLHLSGKYFEMFVDLLQTKLPALREEDLFVCVNEAPWHHHFEAINYKSLHEMITDSASEIFTKPFIKIAKKIPLTEWNHAFEFYKNYYEKLLQLIA